MSNYKVGDLASLFPSPNATGSEKSLQSLFNQYHKKNIKVKSVKEVKKSSDIHAGVPKNAIKRNSVFASKPQSLNKPKIQKFENTINFNRTKKKKQNRQFAALVVSNNPENIFSEPVESEHEVAEEYFKDFKNANKQSMKPKKKRIQIKKESENMFNENSPDHSENGEAEESFEDFKNVNKQSMKPKKKKRIQIKKESENIFNENSPEHSENEEDIQKTSEKKSKKNFDGEEYLPCTLFVGNLPMSSTRKTLSKLFRPFGKLKNCRIRGAVAADSKVPKKAAALQKKLHKGMKSQIGYVVFGDRESATNALSLNGTLVENHHIIVNFAARSGEKKLYEVDQSIFIGNLPYDIDEETVWTAFQSHGDVKAVRIIRDRVTGLGKGFGYVQFKDSVSKNNVLSLEELAINKRKIRIKSIVNESIRKQGAKDAVKMIRFNLALNKAKLFGTKKSVKKLLKKERIIHQKKQIASKLGQKFVK